MTDEIDDLKFELNQIDEIMEITFSMLTVQQKKRLISECQKKNLSKKLSEYFKAK